MDQDKKGYIRFLYNRKNLNISQISRETGLCRETIRRAINGEKPHEKARKSKLDQYKQDIQSILKDNPHISNILILEKIKEKGYQGGRSILGDYLLKIRKPLACRSGAFMNIETLPGKEAQVDWAYCKDISCGKHKRKLYLFCMILSYSRCLYIEFTTSMRLDTFLACHIHAFDFFGGIPSSILYDNLKSVVTARYGRQISFNARYLDFATYYGFDPRVCNVRAANEKGKVERAIRYIKNNFINGYIANFPEGNYKHIRAQSMIWLNKTANQRLHSVTRKIPQENFLSEEKKHLLLLPHSVYDYPEPQLKRVHKDCLLEFETNKYSLPSDYANKLVILKAYSNYLKIFSGSTKINKSGIIAEHNRCYDKYCKIINPDHYKELIEKKKKAVINLKLRNFAALSAEAEEYLKGLTSQLRNVHFHIDKILELETIFGKTAVAQAIARALNYNAFGWEYIKNILLQNSSVSYTIQTTNNRNQDFMNIDVDPPNLALYDNISQVKTMEQDDNGL